MTPHSEPQSPHASRWIWLGFLSSIGIATLAGHARAGQEGFPLLSTGLLLLGFFAFHHDPLSLQGAAWEKLSPQSRLAAVAGLAGVMLVIAAAVVALAAR